MAKGELSMTASESVTVDVEVAADPARAFIVFTERIGSWYRPGTYYWADPDRAVLMKLEPGVGGRLLEFYDQAADDCLEIGRVTVWQPGKRLILSWMHSAEDASEVEVRFATKGASTAVTLEHRGWDRVSRLVADQRENYRQAWTDLMRWYAELVAA